MSSRIVEDQPRTFSLLGFVQSQDSATLVNVNALADQHVRVNGADLIMPQWLNYIFAIYALGASTTRAQLFAPSFRDLIGVPNFEIKALDVGAEPLNTIPPVLVIPGGIGPLPINEKLNALAAENAAGAARSNVLVWAGRLGPQITLPESQRIFTIRTTNASTLTANVWSNGALTFDQTLKSGIYAILGARYESTGGQAFRFVLSGAKHRPGALGHDAVTDMDWPLQRYGGLGVWGYFDSDVPPTVDFLADSADTSQVVDIDLLKISEK